ncbi:MAG TPA: hypothetical protein VG843_08955 [Rhizomicrobium sp.]|nr:hypothetical protein [Rhizomicrobium sp.]
MAAIDQSTAAHASNGPADRFRRLAIYSALAGLLIGWIGFNQSGGGEIGARSVSNLISNAAQLLFVLYYVAGPLSRLVPLPAAGHLGREEPAFAGAFVGTYASFLFWVLMPGLSPGERLPAPTLAFAILSAAALLGLAQSRAARTAAGRAIRSVSIAYFWVAFALADLDRLIGPHRPEPFYGASLLLLSVAVIVRFADDAARRLRAQG